MKQRNWVLWLVPAIAFAGCKHADPIGENTSTATFSAIQSNVFSRSCALSGCHVGDSSSLPGVMDLRAGKAYAGIVGIPSKEQPNLLRINPGDPNGSYLIRKLEGGPDISGARMPFGRSPLSQEQIDLLRQWVAAGAEEN